MSVVRILPSLGIRAGLASLCCIYVLYLGLPRLIRRAAEKAVTYTLVVVACGNGTFIVAGLISGAIVGAGAMLRRSSVRHSLALTRARAR